MKIVVILFVLMASSMFAQNDTYTESVTVYGCIEIEKGIHIKQTEVSLGDWFAFIYDQYPDGDVNEIEHLLPILPDTSSLKVISYFKRNYEVDKEQWKEVSVSEKASYFPLMLSKLEKKDLTRIKRFCNMPVTGLSEGQISQYLEWQTNKLMIIEKQEEFQEYSMLLSLPTEAIYEKLLYTARRSTMDSVAASQSIGDSVNIKGCPFFNFYSETECKTKELRIKLYGSPYGLTEIQSYFPDQLGLYNILGNVSEMTNKKNIVFGGNYSNFASQILEEPFQKVELPNNLVGFRYLVTLQPYND